MRVNGIGRIINITITTNERQINFISDVTLLQICFQARTNFSPHGPIQMRKNNDLKPCFFRNNLHHNNPHMMNFMIHIHFKP